MFEILYTGRNGETFLFYEQPTADVDKEKDEKEKEEKEKTDKEKADEEKARKQKAEEEKDIRLALLDTDTDLAKLSKESRHVDLIKSIGINCKEVL